MDGITLGANALIPLKFAFGDNAHGVWLYQANCLEVLDALNARYPNGCFDMVFADPPYFLSNGGITCHSGRMVKVDKGQWDKSRGTEENHNFNLAWLERCQKALKPNGTIWVTGTHHVIFSVGHAIQQLGFKILNDIAWEKPNPPPNLSCRYFTHSVETVLWAAKNEKSKHVFNYQRMRDEAGGKQMKTVWRFYPPLSREKTLGKHPTQKPVSLIERCILASTTENALVLDPFMGSGTTAIACIQTKRCFVGIEVDREHTQLATKRVANHTHSNELVAVSVASPKSSDPRQYRKSIRQWLIDNDYNDIAELIDEVTAEWDRKGKKTRRNWWEVLAGDRNGKPRVVDGREFPVLRAARLRQGLLDAKGSLSRNGLESTPPFVGQLRWKGHDKKRR